MSILGLYLIIWGLEVFNHNINIQIVNNIWYTVEVCWFYHLSVICCLLLILLYPLAHLWNRSACSPEQLQTACLLWHSGLQCWQAISNDLKLIISACLRNSECDYRLRQLFVLALPLNTFIWVNKYLYAFMLNKLTSYIHQRQLI